MSRWCTSRTRRTPPRASSITCRSRTSSTWTGRWRTGSGWSSRAAWSSPAPPRTDLRPSPILWSETPMALVRCEGIVLKTHALGDTSLIVVAYTREHGMLKLVAKAARKTPSRFGYSLEPLSRSRFVLYHKPDRDLHLLSQAEVLEPTGS